MNEMTLMRMDNTPYMYITNGLVLDTLKKQHIHVHTHSVFLLAHIYTESKNAPSDFLLLL